MQFVQNLTEHGRGVLRALGRARGIRYGAYSVHPGVLEFARVATAGNCSRNACSYSDGKECTVMPINFSDGITAQLEKDIDTSRVAFLKTDYGEFGYLQTHDVINNLNKIFGYAAWSTYVEELKIIPDSGLVYALVRLSVTSDEIGVTISRTDVGVGTFKSARMLDTAIKGAVSDALKRAARTLGNQFGNSLYQRDAVSNNSDTTNDNNDAQTRCEDCNKPILGYTDAKGKTFTAEQLAKSRRSRYGKALCSECVTKYKGKS